MIRIIEMHWKCRHCGNVGPGLTGEDEGLRCANCGGQKADEPWMMPNHTLAAPTVTDKTKLQRAKAGPNWVCEFCRHEERALHDSCSVCGASRFRSESKKAIQESERTMRELDATAETEARAQVAELNRIPRQIWVRAAVAFCVCLSVFWLGRWLFATHSDVATVASVNWKHVETLEELHIHQGSDWASDMPSDAFDKSCDNRLKKHVDCHPYKCRPHLVPYSCNCTGGDSYACGETCSSNGNGSATCRTKYCTRPRTCQTCSRTEYDTCYERCPVYEDHCDYKFPRWDVIKTEQRQGATSKVEWPGLQAKPPGQRLKRTSEYRVGFQSATSKERTWTHEPKTEAGFLTFATGDRYDVEWARSGAFKLKGKATR